MEEKVPIYDHEFTKLIIAELDSLLMMCNDQKEIVNMAITLLSYGKTVLYNNYGEENTKFILRGLIK